MEEEHSQHRCWAGAVLTGCAEMSAGRDRARMQDLSCGGRRIRPTCAARKYSVQRWGASTSAVLCPTMLCQTVCCINAVIDEAVDAGRFKTYCAVVRQLRREDFLLSFRIICKQGAKVEVCKSAKVCIWGSTLDGAKMVCFACTPAAGSFTARHSVTKIQYMLPKLRF